MHTAAANDPRWWKPDYFPASLFGSVMGLSVLSTAWRTAADAYGAPLWISQAIGALAVLDFVFVGLAYLLKAITAPRSVAIEFANPVIGALFGTVFASMLLLPLVVASYSVAIAEVIWWPGAVGMIIFAFIIVGRWIGAKQQIAHATPAWIVPVIGLLNVPLAMPRLGLSGYHDLMIFALALGLFFAVPLFTFVFARLVFEEPMPPPLQPTLLILVAPFAVGYSSYQTVAGGNDLFSHALYMLAMFLYVVVLIQLRKSVKTGFRLAWWATSFPLASAATAALNFAVSNHGLLADGISWIVLVFATVGIGTLFVLSLRVLLRGELRLASTL